MPNITREIPHDSDTAKDILRELRARVEMSYREVSEKHKKWRQAEDEATAFIPEREADRVRREVREGGLPEYTTIKIPYSMAVLMSAHTYLTSVFMSRNPVFQFTGRHGESQQQVQAMEALIGYQAQVGEQFVPLYTWLYDAGKYGFGAIGLWWEQRVEQISRIVSEPELDPILGTPTGKTEKRQETVQIETYTGNRVYNIQPWDLFWDTRFPLRDFQKGEFCGVRFALSWNEMKKREAQGFIIKNALKSIGPGQMRDIYNASDQSESLFRPEATSTTNVVDTYYHSRKLDHPELVKGYEVYAEIIPKEWSLGESDYPEKWVFTCSGDFRVLLGASPLGALHAKFPIHVLPLEVEAYGLVTRGIPETLEPVQQTVDWLLNSHFYNVRAALNNKFFVDPSRIVMKDLLDPLPGGIVRLKPSAYGTNPREAVEQMPIVDVTRNNITDLNVMFGIGERTIGVNDQIMGMLNQGGRKTATEVRTSTTFGVNRLKTIAEWFSYVGFTPLSQMQVQNSQQYYGGEKKFKIVGDLMGTAGNKFMQVTPEMIAGFYDFVPVDGTLPIDRFAQANLWKELMVQAQRMPQIAMGYDWVGIFDWVAQIAGLKNITQFKVQVAPDQQLAAQAQAGNVLPIGGGGPARAQRAGAEPNGNEPRQIPNLGSSG